MHKLEIIKSELNGDTLEITETFNDGCIVCMIPELTGKKRGYSLLSIKNKKVDETRYLNFYRFELGLCINGLENRDN